MVWLPAGSARAATSNVVPPLAATTWSSTDQSTLITSGSITTTSNVVGLASAPSGGFTSSIGVTARQMSMTIFSRDTELYEVFGFSPNSWFIIEFIDGRN